jgi:hypothetical protein
MPYQYFDACAHPISRERNIERHKRYISIQTEVNCENRRSYMLLISLTVDKSQASSSQSILNRENKLLKHFKHRETVLRFKKSALDQFTKELDSLGCFINGVPPPDSSTLIIYP